jgi:hypothetical protein
LNSVGVSLGSNLNKIIVSTNVLRHLEFDRIKVIPKISNVSEPLLLDEEEADTTIDGQVLGNLVGVVSEVSLDEAGLGSLYKLREYGRKSKSTYGKSLISVQKSLNL